MAPRGHDEDIGPLRNTLPPSLMIPAAVRTRLQHDLVLRTALWYAAIFGVAWMARITVPGSSSRAAETLQALLAGEVPARQVSAGAPRGTLVILVAQAMLAAVALSLPIAWVYALTRARRGYQQSVVQMLVLLPMVVAGVVVLVKDSLALAFALAGIVAAVRFRNTLDDSKDAVYVFLATGVGLAAAVDVPVAALASVLFNVLVLAFWYSDFGRPPQLGGAAGERRLQRAREAATGTGSFVARVDGELLREMSITQLHAIGERAARRARDLEQDTTEAEATPREGRLLVRTFDGDKSRARVEALLVNYAKRWEYTGTKESQDGTHVMQYSLVLRKSATGEELLRGVRGMGTPEVIGVELE